MFDRPPPSTTDPDMIAYLDEMFDEVETEIRNSGKFIVRTKVPPNPEKGRLYYFGGAVDATITSEGWWGYKSTGWVNVA